MQELVSVVTRKGQITVPAPIRKALDLREGDKIVLILENDQVRLRRGGSVVAQTAGMLRTREAPLSAKQLREASEQAIADDSVGRFKP